MKPSSTRLLRSLEVAGTGRVLDTEVSRTASSDTQPLEPGWLFDWKNGLKRSEVYKRLVSEHRSLIYGLLSTLKTSGYVLVHLPHTHPRNISRDKQYIGVPEHLFVYTAKLAFELCNEAFVVFVPNSNVIQHYERTLGADRIGSSQRMFLDTKTSSCLLELMTVIREPEGVDFAVAKCHPSRHELLETAQRLNQVPEDHDQAVDLQLAMQIVGAKSKRANTA